MIIDGATPLSSPLLTEDELAQMREGLGSAEALQAQQEAAGTPYRVLLTPDEMIDLQREIDLQRRSATERFDRVTAPITMIMSEFMAGDSGARALEINAAWRAAVDSLVADRPAITVHRVAAGHDLVVTHPDEVARHVEAAAAELTGDGH